MLQKLKIGFQTKICKSLNIKEEDIRKHIEKMNFNEVLIQVDFAKSRRVNIKDLEFLGYYYDNHYKDIRVIFYYSKKGELAHTSDDFYLTFSQASVPYWTVKKRLLSTIDEIFYCCKDANYPNCSNQLLNNLCKHEYRAFKDKIVCRNAATIYKKMFENEEE